MHGANTTTRETVELATPDRAAGPPVHRTGRWWRGLTGSLAAGLLVLALFVLGVYIASAMGESEGPGIASVIGHLVGAVVAVIAQVVVDRSRGRVAGVAALCVFAAAGAVLWFYWWA
ncbi:hypothetical protein [Prauserella cavernicola]|uniref:Uncharacterized protein n=1 Tax=Prauserella cavernicola TaxID=2800127 RepID=A0A934V7T9_9PSEU|nr:hypothetical protein [Prauserella cavernicola]MBK1788937.1 hypothetical protein [Prauserella cavernicola]